MSTAQFRDDGLKSLEKQYSAITKRFEESAQKVFELVEFDNVILDICIQKLESLKDVAGLKSNALSSKSVQNHLDALRAIRINGSLHKQYEAINDQALVLLVSHFASAIGDVFRSSVGTRIILGNSDSLNSKEIKITLSELRELNIKSPEELGDLIVDAKGTSISFQDMNSIRRAFHDYLDCEIPKDSRVNNLIVAQACRNTIVHDSGLVNERVKRQVENASPRTLKQDIRNEKVVHFNNAELELVRDDMLKYLNSVVHLLKNQTT